MAPPARHPLAAILGLTAAAVWFIARTTPGLALITVGSVAGYLGHPRTALAAVAAGALTYAAQCSRTPYAPCFRCKGTGHHRLRRTRACRPCRGRGVRMRWGRGIANAYRRATRPAATAPVARPARPPAAGTYFETLRDHRR